MRLRRVRERWVAETARLDIESKLRRRTWDHAKAACAKVASVKAAARAQAELCGPPAVVPARRAAADLGAVVVADTAVVAGTAAATGNLNHMRWAGMHVT